MINHFYIGNLQRDFNEKSAARVKNHSKSCNTSKFTADTKIDCFRAFVIFIWPQCALNMASQNPLYTQVVLILFSVCFHLFTVSSTLVVLSVISPVSICCRNLSQKTTSIVTRFLNMCRTDGLVLQLLCGPVVNLQQFTQ